MTATAASTDDVKGEAARLAFALIRFQSAAAHPMMGTTPPGVLKVGTEAYVFSPSWRSVPLAEVEAFLYSLPSPALLAPTMTRGVITLTLLHELSGDLRRWAEKTLGNFAAGLEQTSSQLGLSAASRVLLEFDDESHVFSFAGVWEWSQQLAVDVGWSIAPLEGDDRADVCMMLMRSDGKPFQGRSCIVRPGWSPLEPDTGVT